MTPEEAYEKTERKWKAIAGGDLDVNPGQMTDCGLCRFAFEMRGALAIKVRCWATFCPVPPVFGEPCAHLDWIQACAITYDSGGVDDLDEYLSLAQEVLEQLTIHKEQLIAEMEKIYGEKRGR